MTIYQIKAIPLFHFKDNSQHFYFIVQIRLKAKTVI